MDSPALETIVRIPWGDGLTRTLSAYPQRSEADDPEARQSPAIPSMRVFRGEAVAVLNVFAASYVPSGTVQWWLRESSGGEVRARRAAYPFAGGAVHAVDFWVDTDGTLVLLEQDGPSSSRVAVIGPDGGLGWHGPVDGGPYTRVVPDDRGALFLVSQAKAALVPFDRASGRLGAAIAITPGTRAALAANVAAAIAPRHLTPDAARVAKPAGIADALVYLFGVDGDDAYYTVSGGELLAVTFGGEVQRRLAIASVPALITAPVGPKDIQSRPGPTTSWQVDRDGRVYVPRVTPEELQVVRVTMPR